VGGRLAAVDFPADYDAARNVLAQESAGGAGGDVLVLPLSSYRQPPWNEDHKVLDPLGRFQPLDYVAGDDLYVSGVRVQGEDRRARSAAKALALPSPQSRAAGLSRLGIGFVVTERDAGPAVPVAGPSLLDRRTLLVQRLSHPSEVTTPVAWIVAMALDWALFVLAPLVAAVGALVSHPRRGIGK